ncbi:MAG: alpha/beta fold hydrolase [Pseudomonadota bacterium]
MTTLSGQRRPPRSGGAPSSLVVLLHGYGADATDLIGLADVLGRAVPGAEFVSPNAPGFTPHGGREWFPLSATRDPSDYVRGVQSAGPQLQDYLTAELERTGLTESDMALVGFSQGTMMTLHAAYRRDRPIAAVVGFSGLHAEEGDAPVHPCPTLLVHGTSDQVLPVQMTLAASQTLNAINVPVQWHLRPGLAHGIDEVGLAYAADHLARYLPRN